MNKKSIERLHKYFHNTGVDYSEFNDQTMDGAHISRFIRKNIRQGLNLKLVTDKSSGVHFLNYKDRSLLFFLDDMANVQYDDIFIGKERVVDISHYTTKMYYIKNIMKTLLFCDYLIFGSIHYSLYAPIIDDDKSFFGLFVKESSLISDLEISVNLRSDLIVINYPSKDFTATIKLQNNENYLFELQAFDISIKSASFKNFIKDVSVLFYHLHVERYIKLPVSEFTIEHRQILKMFKI